MSSVLVRLAPLVLVCLCQAVVTGQDIPGRVVRVAPSAAATRVPSVLRRGAVLAPQAVSAVHILDDGRVAVCTMAFRHDRNFWLLSLEGRPLWGRQVAPWAPFQVASSAGGGAFGVGMAYSRVTGPQPTISLFAGEQGEETEVVDSLGAAGWLRYGSGDWRTGWIPSLIGDLLASAGDSMVTARGHDGGVRVGRDGRPEKSGFPYARPYRLVASPDGSALAFGFIVPGHGAAGALPWSKSLLAVHDSGGMEERWAFAPAPDLPKAPPLPDPVRDFPELAKAFGLASDPPIPCRVAASVSPTSRASRVAVAEYGGWISLRKGPVIGKWDPPYRATAPPAEAPLRLGRAQPVPFELHPVRRVARRRYRQEDFTWLSLSHQRTSDSLSVLRRRGAAGVR